MATDSGTDPTTDKPSGLSQNIAWTVHKGSFIAHISVVMIGHSILRFVFTKEMAYQVTPLLYNVITFVFFHLIVGDPFDTRFNDHSFWEQMVEQLGYGTTTIFFMVFPIVMFILINHLVVWNVYLFYLNILSLILVVVPKLGFMHRKRVFGLGRED